MVDGTNFGIQQLKSLCFVIYMLKLINSHLFSKGFFSSAKQWVEDKHIIFHKVKILASLIKSSDYPIIFTGAGCSTSIGIPDFRSGSNTIVHTGPGIWNRNPEDTPPKQRIDEIVDKAIPSLTHMAIKTLLDKQIVKHLISQNTDGLHLKSGINLSKISQLHGNRNLQSCKNCLKKYFRDFRTIRRNFSQEKNNRSHQTGRLCENCGGQLLDSIVYFGEKLPSTDLNQAIKQAMQCDLLICVGSSLTVMPSSQVPMIVAKREAKLSIINIQQTPFDSVALKINGFCDQVFQKLMNELDIEISTYVVEHWLKLSVHAHVLEVEGKDRQGNNYSFLKSISYNEIDYEASGHLAYIPFNDGISQIRINFYGGKPSIYIYLPAHYKLYCEQEVNLKIVLRNNQEWQIQEL